MNKNIKKGPWTITDSESKYKNKYGLEVFEDKVIRPDGKNGSYGWVRIGDGVSVLAIDKNHNVYLGKEFQYGLGAECLEPTSGGISEGENPMEAAKRELKEELGIEAKLWVDLGYTNPISGRIKSTQYLFLAYDLNFGDQNLESGEIITKIKMPLKDVVNMVLKNELKDTQSSLIILLAENYLRTHKI